MKYSFSALNQVTTAGWVTLIYKGYKIFHFCHRYQVGGFVGSGAPLYTNRCVAFLSHIKILKYYSVSYFYYFLSMNLCTMKKENDYYQIVTQGLHMYFSSGFFFSVDLAFMPVHRFTKNS